MAITLCTVKGRFCDRAGNLLPERTITFTPPPAVGGEGDVTIMPKSVTTTSDAQARISVQLAPGPYSVAYTSGTGRGRQPSFNILVPPIPVVEIEDIRDGAAATGVFLIASGRPRPPGAPADGDFLMSSGRP